MGRRNQTYGIVHRRSFALNGFLCFFLFSKGRYNYILSEFLFQPKPIILVSLSSLLNTSFSYIGSLSKFAKLFSTIDTSEFHLGRLSRLFRNSTTNFPFKFLTSSSASSGYQIIAINIVFSYLYCLFIFMSIVLKMAFQCFFQWKRRLREAKNQSGKSHKPNLFGF